MRPRSPKLARLRLTRRSPAENPAPPEADGPGGGYLIVRGESRLETVSRRRLVRTPTSRRVDDPRPAKPARIIGHSPGFRRALRRAVAPEAAPSPDLFAPTHPDAPVITRRASPPRLAALAVLFLLVAGAVVAGAALKPPPAPVGAAESPGAATPVPGFEPAAAPPLPLVPASTARGPDPQVRLVAARTHPSGPAALLTAEIIDARPLPASTAVAVTGTVHNPTDVALTAVQLEVTLRAGEVPLRRRDVFCCDDFGAAELAAAVADAAHPHYRSRRGLSTLTVLEAQSSATFVALFPDVPADRRPAGVLGAEARVVTGSSASAVPAPATDVAGGTL
jgi:hypothetical protein